MNIKRGMFRCWLLIVAIVESALFWSAFGEINDHTPWRDVFFGAADFEDALGIPVVIGVILAIVGWVLAGFQRNDRSAS
jgi:hypothetical protein